MTDRSVAPVNLTPYCKSTIHQLNDNTWPFSLRRKAGENTELGSRRSQHGAISTLHALISV